MAQKNIIGKCPKCSNTFHSDRGKTTCPSCGALLSVHQLACLLRSKQVAPGLWESQRTQQTWAIHNEAFVTDISLVEKPLDKRSEWEHLESVLCPICSNVFKIKKFDTHKNSEGKRNNMKIAGAICLSVAFFFFIMGLTLTGAGDSAFGALIFALIPLFIGLRLFKISSPDFQVQGGLFSLDTNHKLLKPGEKLW